MILRFEIQNDKRRVFFVCCHSHISGLGMGSESDFWFWVLGMSQWQFSIVRWRTRRFGPGPASTSSLMGCQDYGIEEDTGYSFFCSMFDSFVLCVNKQLYRGSLSPQKFKESIEGHFKSCYKLFHNFFTTLPWQIVSDYLLFIHGLTDFIFPVSYTLPHNCGKEEAKKFVVLNFFLF